MKILGYAILADENMHPDVIRELRERGCDVRTVSEENLHGSSDAAILDRARELRRVVWTHDRDFGGLAVRSCHGFVGVVFLRPGHIRAAPTLGLLDTIERHDSDVAPPFIVVAERRDDVVRVRVRQSKGA